jgi:hypothetical protein
MNAPFRALKIGAWIVVAVALVALFAAWSYPIIRDMARRHQVIEIIISADGVKEGIRGRVEEKKTLTGSGKGLPVPAGRSLTSATVSDDGVIVMNGRVDGYPVSVALKPFLNAGKVEWRCRGLKVVEGWFVPDNGYFPQACPRAASLESF